MKAVLTNPTAPAHLALGEMPEPRPTPGQALVRVKAFSLNRGEVRGAQSAHEPYCPGWDLAGVVEQAASDVSGPKAGARVVGILPRGAWAQRVAVPTSALAELPEQVTFAQAATLPVAGLTALYCLDKGAGLLGRTVLITGASGGVGHFAVQLARHGGARVVAQVRTAQRAEVARAAGAHEVAIGDDGAQAARYGPYDLIVDGVGGALLGNIIGMLGRGGTCVAYGSTTGVQVSFDLRHFFLTGGLSLYGFILFHEVLAHPASDGLARLAQMVAAGELRPLIEVEAPWEQIGTVAQRLLDREFVGKAVLTL